MVLVEEESVLFREMSLIQGCPYRGIPLYSITVTCIHCVLHVCTAACTLVTETLHVAEILMVCTQSFIPTCNMKTKQHTCAVHRQGGTY